MFDILNIGSVRIVIFIIRNKKYCNKIIIIIYKFGYYIWKVRKR